MYDDEEDIVRLMLKAIATDSAWIRFSLRGSDNRDSFVADLPNIYQAVKTQLEEAFPEKSTSDNKFLNKEVQVYLKHASERMARAEKSAEKKDKSQPASLPSHSTQ